MKRVYSLLLLAATAGAGFGQPVIRSTDPVLNTASYALTGLPNSGIAQGSFFVIFGKDLGPTSFVQVSKYPLQPTFNNISISISVQGTTVAAYPIYSAHFANPTQADTNTQIGAILPSNTPTGTGTLTVTYNNQTSNSVPITVVKSQFGIFTLNQAGSGPASIYDPASKTNPPQAIVLTNSLHPGETFTLWGTGLGPVDPTTEATGPATSVDMKTTDNVHVFIGGQEAAVTFAGRSNCCTGIDQINVTVPQGLSGCYVPITVEVGSTISNYASIPVSAQGQTACSDPNFINASDLQKAQASGSYKLGYVFLDRSTTTTTLPIVGTTTTTTDSAFADFNKYDIGKLLAAGSFASGLINISTANSCTVYAFRGSAKSLPTDVIKPTPLDAGSPIKITTGNTTLNLVRDTSTGFYSLDSSAPKTFLVPGAYTVAGPGGADVGSFTANITIPQPLTWTNMTQITTVNRANGQDVTWSGGDPNGTVLIAGYSIGDINLQTESGVIAGFECIAPNSAGHFTIPSSVLLALPASNPLIPLGFLSVSGNTQEVNFTATGLDRGVVLSSATNTESVNYQ